MYLSNWEVEALHSLDNISDDATITYKERVEKKNQELDHYRVLSFGLQEQIQQLQQSEAQLEEARRESASRNLALLDQINQLKAGLSELKNKLRQSDLLFLWNYTARHNYYKNFMQGNYEESRRITDIISSRKYKGIIVYPVAVHWEPMQRPQQMLIEFSKKGYLCFFCESRDEFSVSEIFPNLFVVSREEFLLPALHHVHVLVLNTWLMQNAWIDCLPNKTIWYDILDRVDFFSYYDKGMLLKHYEVLSSAALVTYSAKKLKEFIGFREDAVLLPNAARYADFIPENAEEDVPPDLSPLTRKRKVVFGYFGAIEEWFDVNFIHALAAHRNVQIVLIGHCNIDKSQFPDNVHFIGPKPYAELKRYARYFDATIIPFVVNDLTNAVSPVKFFEYCAIGKPIIATAIAEVVPYEGPGVTIVTNYEQLKDAPSLIRWDETVRRRLNRIAKKNSWTDRAKTIELELAQTIRASAIFANTVSPNVVGVFTTTFLDFEGDNFYSGGAERYLIDLHAVCSELGLNLEIYQYGTFPWYRKYGPIRVHSLGYPHMDIGDLRQFTMDELIRLNEQYMKIATNNHFPLNIYSAFFQAYPCAVHPSIGISHGVAWDNSHSNYSEGHTFWNRNERFIRGAQNVQKLISVDTNTANWFQTLLYDLAAGIETIPNYVDTEEFFPVPRTSSVLRILYPRRLYAARGLYLVLDIMDDILKKYGHVEFCFVGKGFDADVENVLKKQKKWKNRVHCYHRNPEDMHEEYKKADITLIPTLYSEGTSLSCLEACASGNAVIATRVGGLTDIIINNYNGLLISPTKEALKKAIVTLIEDEELRRKVSRNAIDTAQAFNKTHWKSQWKEVILHALKQGVASRQRKGKKKTAAETVEIRLASPEDIERHARLINELLMQGKDVFLRTEEGSDMTGSFGRLQMINRDTQLYFTPDQVLDLRSPVETGTP